MKSACVIVPFVATVALLIPNQLNDLVPIGHALFILMASLALGTMYAAIHVMTHSHGMLRKHRRYGCVHAGHARASYSDKDSKRFVHPVPLALLAYGTALAIAIVLFLRVGRDLFTVQGFCFSMATQLVAMLLYGVQTDYGFDSLNRTDAIQAVASPTRRSYSCLHGFVFFY